MKPIPVYNCGMKAQFEDLESRKGDQSFMAYRVIQPAFEFRWHYHPEYELTLITKGAGKRLVGDHYDNYEAGDLVLLGPGLPHTWVSNESGPGGNVSAVVVQFGEKFIQKFLELQEFKMVEAMLAKSGRGLVFNSSMLSSRVEALPDQTGVDKITGLLQILQQLSLMTSDTLASPYFHAVHGTENERRINIICQHVQQRATGKIALDETAALVHLSRSAFCKFFRRATGKTFTDYVNDIRIGNVCEQLIASDLPINEIAYRSGFDSLTYFNRVFSRKKGMTPRKYRGELQPETIGPH
ncbi:MAG: AraC family transcriptional regulator [Cyclobacteriaceae bacterium]|nr:AraC family transcriptional regulator [Cyclobacteriaceae bacterium]